MKIASIMLWLSFALLIPFAIIGQLVPMFAFLILINLWLATRIIITEFRAKEGEL